MKTDDSQAVNNADNLNYMDDLVSVIVACYNAEFFISETLESIITQTYRKIEIIIIDDFSTDFSLSIINSYAVRDSRIRIFSNSTNLGPALSRNIGIQHSLGRYIAICDADDTWSSNKLDAQVSFMKNNGVSIVGTAVNIINSEGHFIRKRSYKGDLSKNYQCFRPFPPHSSIIFDRLNLPWDLCYDSQYQIAEDYKLLLDYSIKCRIMSIDDAFINYRIHSNNITKKNFPLFGMVGFSIMARVNYGLDDAIKNNSIIQSEIINYIKNSKFESQYLLYHNFKLSLRSNSFKGISFINLYWLILENFFKTDPRLVLALKIIRKSKQILN